MSSLPSGRMPSARYTALLRTAASSRIFTRKASKNTAGYIVASASARDCKAMTSLITALVTLLMSSGDTSTEYISLR